MRYTFTDGLKVDVPCQAIYACSTNRMRYESHAVLTYFRRNGIMYRRVAGSRRPLLMLAVTGIEFSRDMTVLLGARIRPRTLTFPTCVRVLGDRAFSGVKALKSAVLNNRLEVLGDGAFSGSGITDIELPDALTKVGRNAFRGCGHLRVVYVNDCNCANIENRVDPGVMILPAMHISVGDRLLWDMRMLKNVTLPDLLENIEDYWF